MHIPIDRGYSAMEPLTSTRLAVKRANESGKAGIALLAWLLGVTGSLVLL